VSGGRDRVVRRPRRSRRVGRGLAGRVARGGWAHRAAVGSRLARRTAHGSPEPYAGPVERCRAAAGHGRSFVALAISYFLEGAGYIIAGPFLVAAVTATGPAWLSGSVWTIVGVAALPSCAGWLWLSGYVSRPMLLTGALLLQAAGIAVPAVFSTAPAALIAAVLFGGTFVRVTTLSLATGRHLRVPRAVAILTAGYGVGQVLGPVVIAPTLDGGYHLALLVGAGLVLLAALGLRFCASASPTALRLTATTDHHAAASHLSPQSGEPGTDGGWARPLCLSDAVSVRVVLLLASQTAGPSAADR